MAAVGALVTQTASIQRAVTLLGLAGVTVEGSDSLDAPETVFR
jgi:putative iron-regulated protein